MKKAYLEEVIKKRCHRIQQSCEKIPGHFTIEEIHDLRVEHKKLRAFTRMLQLDEGTPKGLHIPNDYKMVYKAAGPVRDLQLFIPSLKDKLPNVPNYLADREKELFAAKESLVEAIEQAALKKAENIISKHLPSELHDAAVRQFVHKQIAAIQIILLAIEDDEHLHDIRKHLKDLTYNIRVFQDEWGIGFPVVAWKNENVLVDFAAALGNFHDTTIALTYLRDELFAGLPDGERNALDELRGEWIKEKEAKKKELLDNVGQLKLISDF